MMHHSRTWCVSPVATAEELAHMLTERTWTLCSGFSVAGHDYLFLNDATHEDGAGEFGVLKGGLGAAEHVQVESITFSWATYERALALISEALAGGMDGNDFAKRVSVRVETPEQHRRCPLCA